MGKIIIWKDRANDIPITLTKNNTTLTAEEIGYITKAELRYKDQYYSSTDYPSAFDLSSLADDGKIIIRPGLLNWAIGEDTVEVIIYTTEAEDGIMWMQFKASVRADAEKINETI